MSEQAWVVRAGRKGIYVKDFLEKQIVAVGWCQIGDLTNVHGRVAISLLTEKHYPEYTKVQSIVSSGQLYRFRDELIQGTDVVTYDPATRNYHIGKIDGDYKYQPSLNEEMRHTHAVKWTNVVNRDTLTPATRNGLGSIATIFCVSPSASEELLSHQDELTTANAVPLVEETQEAEIEVRKDNEQRALEFLQDKLSLLSWDQMQELVAVFFVPWATRLVSLPLGRIAAATL